ncbi:hypothetical protein BGW39_008328 [Mortierella sp. 14UC]|nr:hypothetical protein BGW39_008328 [Mortierella sp. 14UC]
MGATVSRDHAKLPFGYTHARKDHSLNPSSLSRRKLATRLLRTSDTTSVTPFPIQQDASIASVTTIPEAATLNSSLSPLLVLPPSTLHALSFTGTSSESNGSWTATATTTNPTAAEYNCSTSNNTNSLLQHRQLQLQLQQSSATSTFFVPESGTGAAATLGATLSPCSGSSVAWTNTNHASPAAMTNPDLVVHATASSSTSFSPASVSTSALLKPRNPAVGLLGQQPSAENGSTPSPLQKQRLSQSMRTQEEQDNDMDIISALEIADQKAPYDFFSSSSSSSNNNHNAGSSSSSSNGNSKSAIELSSSCHQHHHNHQHHSPSSTSLQHPSTSTNLEAAASVSAPLVLGASRLEHDDERHSLRTFPGPDRRIRYLSDAPLDIFDEEQQQQRKQRYQQQQPDELDIDLDMGEEGMVKLEGGADESDSILGVELGHLNPIPFSELPSMTSIGLCSRNIVRLSSNIRLLTSATCVQIIPMEIGFLRNLTLLDLSKNCLKSLPESITHLSKLVELKLSFNQLETIPAGIGGLTKLASLTLDNNRITSIPPQIGLIKELVNLDLSDNPIRVLPAEVGKLQFLRRLKLERCPLVEEFVHTPVHSPPTLLELAARVISCSFCDGPYFDSSVKRGKMIEKNEMFIPLEYTLCQPHWNTEMERVKLLFCPRPITSPRPKQTPSTAPQGAQRTNSSTSTSKNGDSATVPTRKQTVRSNSAATTASGSSKTPVLFSADSYSSTASSASATNSPAMSSSSPTMTSDSDNEQMQRQQRVRPTLGHRLSMLLKPKSERRERPLSAFMISTPSSTSTSSASSPSLLSPPQMGEGDATTTTPMTRPSTISRASTGLFGRAGFKASRRPMSMIVDGSLPSPLVTSSPAVMTLSTLSTSG